MSHVNEAFRYGFLVSGGASNSRVAYTKVLTIITLALGVIIFSRTEQTFMDTV